MNFVLYGQFHSHVYLFNTDRNKKYSGKDGVVGSRNDGGGVKPPRQNNNSKDRPRIQQQPQQQQQQQQHKTGKEAGTVGGHSSYSPPTNIGPQPLMSQVVPAPSSMNPRSRPKILAPRFVKQLEVNRLQKQMNQVSEINKINQNMNMMQLKGE